MGLLNKILYGNKIMFKAIVTCVNREHGCVKVVIVDKGNDLEKIKGELKEKLCTKGCEKCTIAFEDITVDEMKSASKVFEVLKY